MMTDPIADMLTRIRNGIKAQFEKVDVPSSTLKVSIAKILKEEGYVRNYKLVKDDKQGVLQVFLKYDAYKESAITGLKRISKSSRRVYVTKDTIPDVQSGLGVSILSTSKGILTDKQARQQGVGGELLCSCW